MASQGEIVPGARIKGKVERHEKFGVFVFLAPGRTGLIPMSETGIAKDGDVPRAFPVGADVDVIVLEVDPSGRRIRLSSKAIADAHEAEEVREYKRARGRRARPTASARSPTSSAARSSRDRERTALRSRCRHATSLHVTVGDLLTGLAAPYLKVQM